MINIKALAVKFHKLKCYIVYCGTIVAQIVYAIILFLVRFASIGIKYRY